MPFYMYSALDAAGKKLEGTIQANNANEALHSLVSRGFRTPRIVAERASSGAVATAPPPRTAAPGQVKINTPAAAYAPQVRRSAKSSDRERFFLFAQIADQLRAGINPAQIFADLARSYRTPKFRESLGMVAAAASEGRPISDALALWPDLYPEHVVGLIRAGEVGGFLPDSAATVSEQAMNAYKFKRFHWWIWLVAINGLLAIPMVFMWRHSILATWDQYESTGGQGGMGVAFGVLGKTFLWPWLPVMIGVLLVTFLLRHWFSSRPMRQFRHEVGLKTPVLGGRARHESITVFTWVLSRLAKGGVPPNRSWDLAVHSVPNLAMQDRLKHAGGMLSESTRLSDVVFGSKLFPEEYAPTISTGELTGDISGALERLSQISRTEYDAGTVKSKAFTGSLGCIALLITSGILMAVVAWVLDHELLNKATKDTPLDPNSSYSQE